MRITTRRSLVPLLSGALLAASALPATARAQIRASELAAVSQTIDGTKVTVEYSRPRMRGRAPLFGERGRAVVHWGEVWTPGANYATTLETNKAITLAGHAIAPGKYSLWLIPAPQGPWTMVFDPQSRLFHMEPPDSSARQIRFAVEPLTGPAEEALTFAFTNLGVGGATLEFRWGTTRIAMPYTVTPSLRVRTPVAEAAQLAGEYEWRFTTTEGGTDTTTVYRVLLGPGNGYLNGTILPATWPDRFTLVRAHPTRDWYMFAFLDGDQVVEVETTWVAEFARGADGRITGFVVRDDTDKLQVRARKLP